MAFFPTNFMLQTPHHHHEDQHQPPPSLNSILPQDYHGGPSFLGKRSMSFSSAIELGEETNGGGEEDNLSDDGSQLLGGEKKRRLSMEQVKTLEKSFELGNKLEPERKIQLARALNLQPRQVAIWFQNRRARWKTKQLEKDYDLLKRQYDAVKSDNDSLQAHNQKLQAEIMVLKSSREPNESTINLNIKETEGSCSNRSDENSSEIKLDISRTPASDSPLSPHHNNHQQSINLFPTSSSSRPAGIAQLFQTSSRPDHHLQCQKIDQIVKEESLSNMFCGMDDQTGFWPWLEQQQFN